ncbi:hypothetical protein DXN05_16455 [Deminuibacter soli]|uniref:DUF4595 domain-containing protein n=2 Tax=Deminuibacter soli TaxID=2291815 RepID=A0A3E1NGY0_9BACT|nr:hypothetical protein DXN05_16455 [Deminuibacter soli]
MAALLLTLTGCQKDYSVDTLNAASGAQLKTVRIYFLDNNVAAGDDTLHTINYLYDARQRLVRVLDSNYNKDGARYAGALTYNYDGTSKYPSAATSEEDNGNGFMEHDMAVFRFDANKRLVFDSSIINGSTISIAWTGNTAIRTMIDKTAGGTTTMDTLYLDDKRNITKETTTQLVSGYLVNIVTTNTYTNYANPFAAYPFPPMTTVESANLPQSIAIVATDVLDGSNLYKDNATLQYKLDDKGRVIEQASADGNTKFIFSYY